MLDERAAGRLDYGGLVHPDRVHSCVYTDPEIFEAEMEIIFGRGWVFVGHESEVPRAGDYRTSHIGRQPVILSRGADNRVHVLMNRCTHRGSTICAVDSGNATFFKCPYHQWAFRTSGELVAVPYPGGYGPEFDRSAFDLARPPRVAAYRGFVFASLAASGVSLDDHLGPLVKEQIDIFLDLSPTGQIDSTAGVNRFTFKGNWKIQLENTADAYHINLLHRSFLDVLAEHQGIRIDAMSDESSPALNTSLGRGHTMMDLRPFNRARGQAAQNQALRGGDPQAEYRALLEERHGRERTAELLEAGGTHMGVWPNLGVLASMVRRIRPVAVDLTEVILTPALLQGVPDAVNVGRLRGHEGFFPPAGMGGSDDQEVFERMQIGFQATVNPWVFVGRGMHRETVHPNGATTAQVTDELNTRAIFQHWRAVMAGDDRLFANGEGR